MTEDRFVRSVRTIARAYGRPPLSWTVRLFEWIRHWPKRWPFFVAFVVAEWAILYLTGVIG